MAKITVILPSYNVREYIAECLESVIGQKHGDLEILCIDAGSTDGTIDILRQYESRDSRVHVIVSEKKSYGYQVNLGIKESVGDYVGIVEADDWIEPDMYSTLLESIERSGADYIKSRGEMYYTISESVSYDREIPVDIEGGTEIHPDKMPELILKDYYLWSGLYKRDLIRKVTLNETPGAAYQDIGFLIQLFLNSKKAVYIDKVFYHYRKSNEKASSYAPDALKILLNEYNYVEHILADTDRAWMAMAEKKLILQAFHRIQMMAYSGAFRDAESLSDLKSRIETLWHKGYISAKDYNEYEWYNISLFMESPRALYDRFFESMSRIRRSIDKVLSITAGKNCIIFGCGKIGVYLSYILLKKNKTKGLAFCDNSTEKQGTSVNGITVYGVEEAAKQFENPVYITTGNRRAEMHRQLLEMGIIEDDIAEFNEAEDYGIFLMI